MLALAWNLKLCGTSNTNLTGSPFLAARLYSSEQGVPSGGRWHTIVLLRLYLHGQDNREFANAIYYYFIPIFF